VGLPNKPNTQGNDQRGERGMKKGFKLYTDSIPPADDATANSKEAITLGDLLAEYDLGVLKRWAEEQHAADAAQEVPEKRK